MSTNGFYPESMKIAFLDTCSSYAEAGRELVEAITEQELCVKETNSVRIGGEASSPLSV
jgi:hypothetical protein